MINYFFHEKTKRRRTNDKLFITNKIKALLLEETKLIKVVKANSTNHYTAAGQAH